ncbi:MAG: hypothetical protein DCC75_10890 [Proteobacteria bacterium]|nr:MAG: hypothetical protein DCC75_10890 [Pseudomonadota bacterium]
MKPICVLCFNDWPVYPQGKKNAGGEMATMHLARAFAAEGYTTVCIGNLPEGSCKIWGIEFIDVGPSYDLRKGLDVIRSRGCPYYLFCATLLQPAFEARHDPLCLARIMISHSPFVESTGFLPKTASLVPDYLVCVSYAQGQRIVDSGAEPSRVKVVRNGYDPEIYRYAPPEGRDYKQIVFAGQLSHEKGIVFLMEAYLNALQQRPDLKLSVYGKKTGLELDKQLDTLQANLPGFKYHGPASQEELAKAFSTAGLTVFASVTFETCGLVAMDAQASGCPVLAFNVGGVTEVVRHETTGYIMTEITSEELNRQIIRLTDRPEILRAYSANCEKYCREQTWRKTACDLAALAQTVLDRSADSAFIPIPQIEIKSLL